MGLAFVVGACLVCEKYFTFNPIKVPSFRVNDKKEPICGNCMRIINERRVKLGEAPFIVPKDAYKPCKEEELG